MSVFAQLLFFHLKTRTSPLIYIRVPLEATLIEEFTHSTVNFLMRLIRLRKKLLLQYILR
jgi:hypothetical protein